MSEIIRNTSRGVGVILNYAGMCDRCSSPVSRAGWMTVIEIGEISKGLFLFVPIDDLRCPECGVVIARIQLYDPKLLDITSELESIRK